VDRIDTVHAMRPNRPAPAATIQLDGRRFDAAPGETLLDAAQRAGVALPFSCRVGGCGTCRCRVLEGKVEERTESAYLLSDDEIARGVVLACQGVPRGAVRIARVDAPAAAVRRVGGAVLAQRQLAPGVVRVEVQLDQGLPFAAGQHALLRLGEQPGLARPYSFATPARADGCVSFIVRHHAGGALSTRLCHEDLRGRAVQVEGPFGDFALREGAASWLFVATGTGLAPVLALLHEALERGVARPAAVLFGARTREDLFARDELDALAARWPGGLRVLPVLSRAGADWDGARGRVTDHLAALLADDVEAWLCGSPAIVDDAGALLRALGVPASRVHADRFTAAAPDARSLPPATAADRGAATAGWRDYLTFSLFHAVGLVALAALVAGGGWTVAGLLGTVGFYVLGDLLLGDELRSPRYERPALLTAQLWLALPLLAAIVFAATWTMAPGDPLGFGAWVQAWTGYDALAAREASGFGTRVAAWLLTGLMIGMVGTIPAHELVHRTWDRASLAIGRWLLAFSFDTSFSVEHVHGHHRHVATPTDPASAPRGRNVYAHILHSTLHGNLSAWRIEARRLRVRGHAAWSWRNVVLRGHAMELALLAVAFAIGGAAGAGFFALCALWGKALLEIVNYMEHYGIAREPGTPVAPRHSWNTNRRISSWSMFNLTRHSHHHAQGEAPFHALQPFADAPQMPTGYLGTILLALVPPLWRRVMAPRLADWDARFASPAERLLVAKAVSASGGAESRERPIAA
jgi:ferredoxin-NADP reductase/ferredoxin